MMKGNVLYQFIKKALLVGGGFKLMVSASLLDDGQNNDNKELSECEGTGPFFNSF